MIILAVVNLYFGLGVAFAIAFVIRGAGVIDPVARASAWQVRLLWLPGAAALWPYLLLKWMRAEREGV